MAGPIQRNRFPTKASMRSRMGRAAHTGESAEASDTIMQVAKADEAVNSVLGPMNWALMAGGFATILAGGIDMVRRAGTWTFNKIPGVKPIGAPKTSLNAITFENIGADKAAQVLTAPTHGLLGGISDAIGLSGWRVSANASKAAKHLASAHALTNSITLNGVQQEAIPHLQTLVSAAQSGHPANLASAEVTHALQALEGSGFKLGDAGKFVTKVSKAAEHQHGAMAWSNVSKTIKDAPKALAKTPVAHGMVNGSFIAMSGLSMFTDSREFLQNLEVLKQMHMDITGKKISTAGLLLGNVPPLIAQERSHLVKLLGVKMSADIVSMGVNIKQILSRHFSGTMAVVGFMGADAVSRGASTMMGEPATNSYKEISLALKTGQSVDVQKYKEFLLTACSDLKNHKSGKDFAEKLAVQYAAEKMTPGAILKKITNGGIMQDIRHITDAADAAQTVPENQTSMVQKLKEGNNRAALTKADKPILGKHTNQVVGHETPGNIVAV